MNVSYKDINTLDAARMLKVDKSSVIYWCTNDFINYTNVSDGVHKKRYLISEEEIDYIKSLIKKHGKRKWRKFYDKDWNKKEEKPMNVITSDEAMFIEEVREKEEKENKPSTTTNKVDIDSVAITIGYIQDIKERLKDLEAEKAQLLNEYSQLKQEVISAISLDIDLESKEEYGNDD